ncbi:Heavy metal-associated isoprenylated plant protein 19 [Sesamum alatum]|uniref:Heavy metal-associated isoprenylated plant protein 19 n=1 Tax=Sesamum alatum TaxID=300844 RepID=A0AAE1Y9M4_9LAMI|nr:Heavy metal-associated isoprenylated plant protein 19 [Sesamum alatum]
MAGNKEDKAVVAQYRVSMHCNGCERTVVETVSNIKGVEKFVTDMNGHKVIVTGRIDPQKVLKKLRKETGKSVELVVEDEDGEDHGEGEVIENDGEQAMDSRIVHYYGDGEIHMMFNDENANACTIM